MIGLLYSVYCTFCFMAAVAISNELGWCQRSGVMML